MNRVFIYLSFGPIHIQNKKMCLAFIVFICTKHVHVYKIVILVKAVSENSNMSSKIHALTFFTHK